jgi:hypothetical protein
MIVTFAFGLLCSSAKETKMRARYYSVAPFCISRVGNSARDTRVQSCTVISVGVAPEISEDAVPTIQAPQHWTTIQTRPSRTTRSHCSCATKPNSNSDRFTASHRPLSERHYSRRFGESSATNAAPSFPPLRSRISSERLTRWSSPSRCVLRCARIVRRSMSFLASRR